MPDRVGDRVEIGGQRELVEILAMPEPAPRARTGRIRHANGENASVDHGTWIRLRQRAIEADGPVDEPVGTLFRA